MPISAPTLSASAHGVPITQANGRSNWPRIPSSVRPSGADQPPDPTQAGVDQRQQREEREQHGRDVERELEPGAGALGGGVDHVRPRALGLDADGARGQALLGLRHHQLRHHQRRRSRHHAGREQMTGDVGTARRQDPDVGGHHAAGDGGEPAGHHRLELGAGHGLDVGPDQERRLGLARRRCCRRRQRLRARRAHHPHHDPGEALDHPLHHAQVVEDGDEAREEDDGRQHLEREEVIPEVLAEDEDRAAVGEVEEAGDGVAHGVEELPRPGGAQDDDGEHELQQRCRRSPPAS